MKGVAYPDSPLPRIAYGFGSAAPRSATPFLAQGSNATSARDSSLSQAGRLAQRNTKERRQYTLQCAAESFLKQPKDAEKKYVAL